MKFLLPSQSVSVPYVKTQEENKQEIEDLRTEVDQLTTTLKLVVLQHQHDRENEKRDREMFELQVENELLRRLPPKDGK